MLYMKLEYFNNFNDAIEFVREKLIEESYVIRTEKWQGIPLEHDMRETLNTSFKVFMPNNLAELMAQVKPNLPWADRHFEERVNGFPVNPGKTYKLWPFYKMDKEMRNVDEKFTHSYMERIWPKYAGIEGVYAEGHELEPLKGIRYEYGDLNDLIRLLGKEPFTRQAYLPIFFPEDTGAVHGGRIPCTIGYHFIRRDNYLHIVYHIRSCDYLRHFRDDIYLAVRKVIWLINELAMGSKYWENVKPGIFTMHITSLHIFENEFEMLKRHKKK
jgi:hypothetical protein